SRVTCTMVDIADQTFLDAMFDPVFGNPRDTAVAALNNGPSLVCNSTPELMQSMHWFVQYGPLSSEPNNSNYFRGDHLMQKLAAQGVTNEISPILDGGHNWGTADEHMRQTLPLHWSALGPATVYPFRVDSVGKNQTGSVSVHALGVPMQMYKVQTTSSLADHFETVDAITAD